jgi:hypothetical protein
VVCIVQSNQYPGTLATRRALAVENGQAGRLSGGLLLQVLKEADPGRLEMLNR